MRLHKSPAELELMRKAMEIAVEAHNHALKIAAPGRYEYEIQAEIEHIFRLRGGMGLLILPLSLLVSMLVCCTILKIIARYKRRIYC